MKYYITILLFLSAILSGCAEETSSKKHAETSSQKQSEQKENDTKEEVPEIPLEEKKQIILTFFQQDIGNVNQMEVEALQTIATTSSETLNNQVFFTELVNKKIPDYEATISQMKELEPKFAELNSIKEKIVLANEIYFEALKLQQKAIETHDLSLLEKANEKMNQYLMVIEDYHYLVEELSQKYQIDLSNG